jgi:hypothetical protein
MNEVEKLSSKNKIYYALEGKIMPHSGILWVFWCKNGQVRVLIVESNAEL